MIKSEKPSLTADDIRYMRERLDKTQVEMADMLGVHWTAYQKWELGVNPINRTAALLAHRMLASFYIKKDNTPFAYVYSVPHFQLIKIGHSTEIRKRLYHLKWGRLPAYIPLDAKDGAFIKLLACHNPAQALLVERKMQNALYAYRLNDASKHHGTPEWFKISEDEATLALESVYQDAREFLCVVTKEECNEYLW